MAIDKALYRQLRRVLGREASEALSKTGPQTRMYDLPTQPAPATYVPLVGWREYPGYPAVPYEINGDFQPVSLITPSQALWDDAIGVGAPGPTPLLEPGVYSLLAINLNPVNANNPNLGVDSVGMRVPAYGFSLTEGFYTADPSPTIQQIGQSTPAQTLAVFRTSMLSVTAIFDNADPARGVYGGLMITKIG